MKTKKSISMILAGLLLFAGAVPGYAVTDEQIGEAEQQKEETQAVLGDTEERIAALEEAKGQSETYLTELSTQLDDLTNHLETLHAEYTASVENLDQIEQELQQAEAEEADQYDAMKLRIQYMYESMAGNGMISNLFAADDLSDFISRASMVSELTDYDRDKLSEYQDTVREVEDKKSAAEQKQQEINQLQEETTAEQEEVQEIYESTYNDLMAYAASLDDAQSEAASLVSQIQAQEEQIDALLVQQKNEEIEAQRKAEEEAAAQAAAEAAAAAEQADTVENTDSTEAVESTAADTDNTAAEQNETEDSGTETEAETGASTDTTDTGSSQNGTYLGTFTLTAYCPCSICCGSYASNPGVTASGAMAEEGVTVAMGGVPFGTKLSINGHIYTVQDRGTAYGHVDIYFNSHSAALAFGMQSAEVYQVG